MNKDIYTYLKTVAEEHSISRAAEKLGVSQPAISSQIKKIEEEYGVEIYDRTTQPLSVTAEGTVLISYFEKNEKLKKDLKAAYTQINGLEKGTVNVGGASAFNMVYMPGAVKCFSRRHPGVKVNIIDDNMPSLAEKTLNGDLDLFIASPMGRLSGISFEKLLSTNVYLCVPREADINNDLKEYAVDYDELDYGKVHREVRLSMFEDLPFIKLSSDRHMGKLLLKMMKEHHVKKEVMIQADQSVTSYVMTCRGLGVSLMSGVDIKNIPLAEERPCYYMLDRRFCRRDMYVAYAKGRMMSPAGREFKDILMDSVSSLKY